MLQRAASNAYSWWWASHIRTKQSKWLEHNLQDMEDRVSNMLKIIDEDGDSFAKRAEMYYKKRPELTTFVEESYRAYRALAERYDHLSRDMQNANRTIASAFPEQVQFMDDDDDEHSPRKFISKGSSKDTVRNSNAPKIPKLPMKELTSRPTFISRKKRFGRTGSAVRDTKPCSGLSKDEALGEIDKLQKEILGLQTEKEFVKSSYENGLAKYWEIENQIIDMQGRVYSLQDEFGFGTVIDDDEARTLMADAALKSCQRALIRLQEEQEMSVQESRIERQRIEEARTKFEILRDDLLLGKQLDLGAKQDVSNSDQSAEKLEKGRHEIVSIQETTEKNKNPNIAAEPVEMIDGLHSKQKLGKLDTQRLVIESIQEKMKETSKLNSKNSRRAKQVAKKMDDLREKQVETQGHEIESLRETIKGKLEEGSKTSFTASELAEKIDELADKVISLETAVSSQTALVKTLRSETSDLQEQIQVLEEEKETLLEGSDNMSNKLIKIEKELDRVQNLNQTIEDQNHLLQTHFTEATCNFDHLSNKLQNDEPEKAFEKENKDQDNSIHSTSTKAEGDKEIVNISEERGDDDPELVSTSLQSEEGNEQSIKRYEENGVYLSPRRDSNVPKQVRQETEIENDEVDETFSNPFVGTFVNPFQETFGNPFGNPFESFSKIEEATVVNPDSSDKVDTLPEEGDVKEQQNQKNNQELTEMIHSNPHSELNESGTEDGDEPNWKQLFVDGLEKREKVLLTEYTSNLRNFKEVKKKLTLVEKMNRDSLLKSTMEIKQLKNDNTFKDEEIRSLRQKLNSLQSNTDETFVDDSARASSISSLNSNHQPLYVLLNDKYFEASAKSQSAAQTITNPKFHSSNIEEKIRAAIDDLLEENLEFWLRFSTSFHQIQKFQTSIHDLQFELSKLKEKQETSGRHETLKSDMRPIYKHLREIQTELKLWFKHNSLLKEELKTRLSSLCTIEEELLLISSSRAGSREEMSELSHFQAAKFQGEVQNMKQENHKVADELKAGLNRVNALRVEIEGTLSKMDEDFGFSEPTNNGKSPLSRSRIPLRSFLFGVRLKKHKPQSLFACINPTLQKQYSDLASGLPP